MDDIRTKTMAELYVQQGHLKEALHIYQALLEKDPLDIEIKNRIKELSERLRLSSPIGDETNPFTNETIKILKRWLANIEGRKRGSWKRFSFKPDNKP